VTFHYRIYGLCLSSDSAIPGLHPLPACNSTPDLHGQFASEPEWVRHALTLPRSVLHTLPACAETRDPAFVLSSLGDGQFFQLDYSDGARFVTDAAATRVWGAPGPAQTLEDLATYFLGPILGYLLRRRGTTALHASAVCLDGKAIAFAGGAGSGKSTTAAAFALRGSPILCEDIAALEEEPDGFHLHAGHSRICLWPESVRILFGQSEALPLLTPTWDKRFLALDGALAVQETRDCPLGAIYLFAARASANAPRIEEVSSRDVLVELVQNTYMNWLLERRQRADEFALLSRLVSQVPVRRVVPHRNPAKLGALGDLLLADAARSLSGRIALPAAAAR